MKAEPGSQKIRRREEKKRGERWRCEINREGWDRMAMWMRGGQRGEKVAPAVW